MDYLYSSVHAHSAELTLVDIGYKFDQLCHKRGGLIGIICSVFFVPGIFQTKMYLVHTLDFIVNCLPSLHLTFL